jgi:hypothetical protein
MHTWVASHGWACVWLVPLSSQTSTLRWSGEHWGLPGVQIRLTHFEPVAVETHDAPSAQGMETYASLLSAQTDRAESAGPPSQRDCPGSHTGG